jgi:hypothetical protein
MRWRPLPAFAAIDFLSCLLVVFVAVALTSRPPQVKTYGAYAVVVTWPKGHNDVDLFVRDPEGAVSYFAKAQADQMQLEHDDRGTAATGYTHSSQNEERTVLAKCVVRRVGREHPPLRARAGLGAHPGRGGAMGPPQL